MANWYGSARTNYVRVKDMDGLVAALEPFPIEIADDGEGRVCFLSTECDSGGWPSFSFDEETDEEIEFDFQEHVVPFLDDNEVLIAMEVGAEKLRYLSGQAVAYHPDGEQVLVVNIRDIYELVFNQWGVRPTFAEY